MASGEISNGKSSSAPPVDPEGAPVPEGFQAFSTIALPAIRLVFKKSRRVNRFMVIPPYNQSVKYDVYGAANRDRVW
jgi:hypothetical protein